MQCIILAGGFGTRLRPLTYTRQKSLLPVMNKPMIMHIIDELPKQVDRVIIAANYKKEQLKAFFEERNIGREIIVNDEPFPLGTAGAVKNAEKYIDGTFLVINSDVVSSLSIQSFIKYHSDKKSFATISLWPVENIREFGVVKLENDGKITRFVEKPKPENAPSNLINAGHYCLHAGILDMIPKDRMISMEKEIFPKVIEGGGKFYGFKFVGYWLDVGKKSNYLLAHRMLMEHERRKFRTGENCMVGGKLEYSCIGNNVEIGGDSTVRNSVVFDNSNIGDGTTVTDSIIGMGCKIGKNCKLSDSIMGDFHIIEDGKDVSGAEVWELDVPEGYPEKQVGNVIEEDGDPEDADENIR